MPMGLKRLQRNRNLHFVTFTCYRRQPLLNTPEARRVFESVLERVRREYRFFIKGYVVMPQHVHLLMSEPEIGTLATALQVLKQLVSRKLSKTPTLRWREGWGTPSSGSPSPGGRSSPGPFWQTRYYDFNVFSTTKEIEKLKYIHRNPVKRGLVERPEDWEWSSFRHWATGESGVVGIESQWTANRRERSGDHLKAVLKK